MHVEDFYNWLKRIDTYHSAALRRPRLTAPLRLASYAGYRGLELAMGRFHPHGRTLAQATALEQRWVAAGRPGAMPHTGKRVVFFSPRGWFVHSAVEAVLAKALELRGATATFVVCDGGFTQCDFKPASDPHVTQPLCWRCQGFSRRLLEALSLPVRTFTPHATSDELARGQRLIAGADAEELLALEYKGLPIGRLCLPSAQRQLLHTDFRAAPGGVDVLRGLCMRALRIAELGQQLVDEKPDAIVLCNGMFHDERVVYELAVRAGVRVISYEIGWIHGRYFIVDGSVRCDRRPAVAASFPVEQAWEATRNRPLLPEQRARVQEYFAERRAGRGVVELYWPKMDGERGALVRRLGIQPGKRVAVAFPNIVWDTATFERDRGFRSMLDWLVFAIRSFAAMPDWQLVVRTHPAETRLLMQESRERVMTRLAETLGELPRNVIVVAPEDPADSYTLSALADVTLVYTSSLGLENACAGRPVVVAGDVHYAGKGFTFDVDTKDGFMQTVFRAAEKPVLDETRIELARRYSYTFLFECMKEFPFVHATGRADRGLELEALEQLAKGRHRDLDTICEAVLTGAPLVEAVATETQHLLADPVS